MEYFDLYDENRRPLGRIASRSDKPAPGEYHVAVGVWIFDGHGHILLTRRSACKSFAPCKWENTGGHVIAGETSEQAIARELFEETGLVAGPEEFIYIGTCVVPHCFGDNYCLIRDVEAASVRFQPEETDDAQWVTLDEFEAMAADGRLAASVYEQLSQYRTAFNQAFKKLNQI